MGKPGHDMTVAFVCCVFEKNVHFEGEGELCQAIKTRETVGEKSKEIPQRRCFVWLGSCSSSEYGTLISTSLQVVALRLRLTRGTSTGCDVRSIVCACCCHQCYPTKGKEVCEMIILPFGRRSIFGLT